MGLNYLQLNGYLTCTRGSTYIKVSGKRKHELWESQVVLVRGRNSVMDLQSCCFVAFVTS